MVRSLQYELGKASKLGIISSNLYSKTINIYTNANTYAIKLSGRLSIKEPTVVILG